MDSFAERLEYLITVTGIKPSKIADIAGIDPGQISKYRKGKTIPTVDKIQSFMKVFPEYIDWLATGHGESPKTSDKSKDRTNDLKGIRGLPDTIPVISEHAPTEQEWIVLRDKEKIIKLLEEKVEVKDQIIRNLTKRLEKYEPAKNEDEEGGNVACEK